MKTNLWKTIAGAGLLAGSLDIIAALIQFVINTKKNPLIVLQYIASAVYGPEAYGSKGMAALGLLFHFIIAFGWTVLFFLLYPKLKLLQWNRVVTGIMYGIFIWVIMTQVTLPLTKINTGPFDATQATIAVIILIVAIGLPLSFLAHRFFNKRQG
ncbi:MAG: hypothetical protein EOO00_02420 [Chitinophagaceae bacterium]|nr:MAG: hypothetical protein EOO00_02420 [Chitinophagaceae bacterium]